MPERQISYVAHWARGTPQTRGVGVALASAALSHWGLVLTLVLLPASEPVAQHLPTKTKKAEVVKAPVQPYSVHVTIRRKKKKTGGSVSVAVAREKERNNA